ncbi:hypothetical protein N8676_00635 [bacterium]|nr:hypothetical protein [bacterium]
MREFHFDDDDEDNKDKEDEKWYAKIGLWDQGQKDLLYPRLLLLALCLIFAAIYDGFNWLINIFSD